jgi:hypothetical protein
MNRFLALPTTDRRQLCEEAAARLSLDAASIEKDFWICWTLRELFSIPEIGGHLTFKGGTWGSKWPTGQDRSSTRRDPGSTGSPGNRQAGWTEQGQPTAR